MYTLELMNHVGDYLSNIIHLQVMDMTKGKDEEGVKSILGRHTKILVKYMVKLETKGDKTENRVLVFTPVRIYLLIAKVPTKIECHFHYLDIQAVESKKSTHFSIITNDRPYSFATSFDAGSFSANADAILSDLASAIKHIFPTVPLKYIIRRRMIFNDVIAFGALKQRCSSYTNHTKAATLNKNIITTIDYQRHK